jgi:hypothetical protein
MSTRPSKVTRDDFVTPYEISKMLKEKFGIERKPQMLYNYVRNNLIPSEIFETQRLVRKTDAIAWCEKFAAKVTSK